MIEPDRINPNLAESIVNKIEKGLSDKVKQKKETQQINYLATLFDQNVLSNIENLFQASSDGRCVLKGETFKSILSQYIPPNHVENVYKAIDVNDLGFVTYSEFTNFLIASEAGFSFSSKVYNNRLIPIYAQEDDSNSHRDSIDNLIFVKKPCPMLISGGRDGFISLWDPETLSIMTSIEYRDKNAIYQEELNKNMDPIVRAQTNRTQNPKKQKSSKVAVTAMASIMNWGLICVGTADSCVTIYELGTQDVCGRLTDLDSIPSSIECFQFHDHVWKEGDNAVQNKNNMAYQQLVSYIAIGDSSGNVHYIKLHPEFGGSIEVGMKKKNQILFAQSLKENYSKLHVHKDWISQMKYISEVNSLIAASSDCTISFIDVVRGNVTKVFKAHNDTNLGIKSFAWSSNGKYLVSGADRVLLLWDPFTLEVISRIDSLRSPVVRIEICDVTNKMFVALINKSVLIYNSITMELLQSITDNTLYKPTNSLSAMLFLSDRQYLYTAGNKICMWNIEKKSENKEITDEEDLAAVIYNNIFNLIFVVKSLGTLRIYNAEAGELVRQFSVRPIDPKTALPLEPKKDPLTGLVLPLILQASLDKNQTRMIIVGADLSVQFWNINDGSRLFVFYPQLYSTAAAHLYSDVKKTIVGMSQELLIPIKKKYEQQKSQSSQQSSNKPLKVLVLSTDLGHVCLYHENQAFIEDIPTAFLRITESEKGFSLHRSLLESSSLSHNKHSPRNRIHKENHSSKFPKKLALHDSHENQSPYFDTILWSRIIPNSNFLIVCYVSGKICIWDIYNHRIFRFLKIKSKGVKLNSMKIKSNESNNNKDKKFISPSPTKSHSNDPNISNKEKILQPSLTTAKSLDSQNKISSTIQSFSRMTNLMNKSANQSSEINQPKDENVEETQLNQELPEIMTNQSVSNEFSSDPKKSFMKKSNSFKIKRPKTGFRPLSETDSNGLTTLHEMGNSLSDDEEIDQSHLNVDYIFSEKKVNKHDSAALTMAKHRSYLIKANIIQDSNIIVNKNPIPLPPQNKSKSISSRRSLTFIPAKEQVIDITNVNTDLLNNDLNSPMKAEVKTLREIKRWTVKLDGSYTATHSKLFNDPFDEGYQNIMSLDQSSNLITNSPNPLDIHDKKLLAPGHDLENSIAELSTSKVLDSMSELSVIQDHQSAVQAKSSITVNEKIEVPSLEINKISEQSSVENPSKTASILDDSNSLIVDAMIVLPNTRILIGACSDHFFRFWDLETFEILCSCPYFMTENAYDDIKPDEILLDETVRHLKVSDSEDVLIAAYDSGMVRVWSMQSYSFTTLRNLLEKHIAFHLHNKQMEASINESSHDESHSSSTSYYNKGNRNSLNIPEFGSDLTLAISPITLISEWFAHHCPIVALDYVWFNYEPESTELPDSSENKDQDEKMNEIKSDPINKVFKNIHRTHTHQRQDLATQIFHTNIINKTKNQNPESEDPFEAAGVLEGYVVTAGLDQKIYLWNINSRCVGEFGSSGWDINDETTWKKKILALPNSFGGVMNRNFLAKQKLSGVRALKKSTITAYHQMSHAPKPPSSALVSSYRNSYSARDITPETINLRESPSTSVIHNFFKLQEKNNISSKEMNRYVETLTRKIIHRPPVYQEVDNEYQSLVTKHPLTNIKGKSSSLKNKK